MDGDLWLSMMRASTKAADLRRDPRILLHSIVTGPEPAAEVKVRGTVRTETGRPVQQRYAATVAAEIGWSPVIGEFTLFAVDIDDVTYIGYDAGSSAQHVARWPDGLEYLRPFDNSDQPRATAASAPPARLSTRAPHCTRPDRRAAAVDGDERRLVGDRPPRCAPRAGSASGRTLAAPARRNIPSGLSRESVHEPAAAHNGGMCATIKRSVLGQRVPGNLRVDPVSGRRVCIVMHRRPAPETPSSAGG